MLDIFLLIVGVSDSPNSPKLQLVIASSKKYMKTPRWFNRNRVSYLRIPAAVTLIAAAVVSAIAALNPGSPNTRLTNDNGANGGYVSAYTLATGIPYTDQTLDECTVSHGRQNEPAVAVDPRDTNVLLGSSNDYCGVYNRGALAGAIGPIWLGYYRSLNGSWTSSLVPGYPDDTSPYAALSQARTSSAGDPVIAWDGHGRAFFGSESSGDPAGTAKTFGDVFVARYRNPGGADAADTTKDGLEYYGTTVIAKGSSAPNLLGKFHDKTSIEADRTGGVCDGNVYFAWARFSGNVGQSNIYVSRSTDHGVTFSNPQQLTSQVKNVQDPSISVTGNGNVYVTWDEGPTNSNQTEGVGVVKSTDCGATFGPEKVLVGYTGYAAQDVSTPQPIPMPQSQPDDPLFNEGTAASGSLARDCGDFADACQSGYTFFRRATNTQATADQYDSNHEWIYVVYDASKGPILDTGTTYGTISPGKAAQTAAYFVRYNGATGAVDLGPTLLDDQAVGHQAFPDVSADGGVLHAFWWDSRHDRCYSPIRPFGNCANRTTMPSLDVFATTSSNHGVSWTTPVKITDRMSNGNFEQFDNRAVPFGGDYLTITGVGSFAFGTWTDWRDTVHGTDPREAPEDQDAATSDVHQCRVVLTIQTKSGPVNTWSGDLCPHDGGIDQNIYGAVTP